MKFNLIQESVKPLNEVLDVYIDRVTDIPYVLRDGKYIPAELADLNDEDMEDIEQLIYTDKYNIDPETAAKLTARNTVNRKKRKKIPTPVEIRTKHLGTYGGSGDMAKDFKKANKEYETNLKKQKDFGGDDSINTMGSLQELLSDIQSTVESQISDNTKLVKDSKRISTYSKIGKRTQPMRAGQSVSIPRPGYTKEPIKKRIPDNEAPVPSVVVAFDRSASWTGKYNRFKSAVGYMIVRKLQNLADAGKIILQTWYFGGNCHFEFENECEAGAGYAPIDQMADPMKGWDGEDPSTGDYAKLRNNNYYEKPTNLIIITDADLEARRNHDIHVDGGLWLLFYDTYDNTLLKYCSGAKGTKHMMIDVLPEDESEVLKAFADKLDDNGMLKPEDEDTIGAQVDQLGTTEDDDYSWNNPNTTQPAQEINKTN